MKVQIFAVAAVVALLTVGIAMAHNSVEEITKTTNTPDFDFMDRDGDGICDFCGGDMPVEECAEMHGEYSGMNEMHEQIHSGDFDMNEMHNAMHGDETSGCH